MSAARIRPAGSTDAATVAHVVATAFHPLDVCQWLTPDPQERASILPHYFRIITEHAFAHGTVEVSTDLAAVAVWLCVPFPDLVDYQDKLATACGAWTPRFRALDEAMHRAHPTDRGPHDYLALLAVMPERQGRGLGTALLQHHHTALDQQHRPAYLEASNSHSRKLYERHGYTDCATPLDLPYEGERMYPMWRPGQT
jgi:GNAT superfamily N-acetyltransferase